MLHIQKFDEPREATGFVLHYFRDPDGNRVRIVPDERLPSPEVLGCDWRVYSVEEPDTSYCAGRDAMQWRVPRAVWNLAVSGFGMAPGVFYCRQCNKPIETRNLIESSAKALREERLCFSCGYWSGISPSLAFRASPTIDVNEVPKPRDLGPNVAIIAGTVYGIADTRPKGDRQFLGFGGARHDILFNDGRRVTTWNLWHRGNIERFARGALPDNAIFLIPEEDLRKRKVKRYQPPHRTAGESEKPTRWRVECPEHGSVYLTEGEVHVQRHEQRAHHCPRCGRWAKIDHERERRAGLTWRQRARELYEEHIEPRLPELKPMHLLRAAYFRGTGKCLNCCANLTGEREFIPCKCGAITCPYCGEGDSCWCPEPEDYCPGDY